MGNTRDMCEMLLRASPPSAQVPPRFPQINFSAQYLVIEIEPISHTFFPEMFSHIIVKKNLLKKRERVVRDLRRLNILWHFLLSAMSEIHGEGLVHADLKPGNILAEGSWYQIENGLANLRLIDSSLAFQPEKNPRPEWWVGTPLYSSFDVAVI